MRWIYAAHMTIRRVPLIVCGAVALVLTACGSDAPNTSTTSTTPSAIATTTTLATGATGSSTPASGGAAASTTTLAAGASTTTTVKGARTVTNPADNLRIGDSGPGVKQVQEALVAKGIKVALDSQYGVQTAKAVQAFQSANGLTADGVCGPKTWAKLGNGAAVTPSTSVTATTTAPATTAAPPTTVR